MAKKFDFEPVGRGKIDPSVVIKPPADLMQPSTSTQKVVEQDQTSDDAPPAPKAKAKPAATKVGDLASTKPIFQPENDDPYIVSVDKFGSGWIIVNLSNHRKVKRTGGTIAWRYNNPGNLKNGPFAQSCGAVGYGHATLVVFPDYRTGHNAMKRLLFSGERPYVNLSIHDAIHKYAPPEDNNDSIAYATTVANAVGVSLDTVLKTLSEKQRDMMIEAMKRVEAYKIGQVLPI